MIVLVLYCSTYSGKSATKLENLQPKLPFTQKLLVSRVSAGNLYMFYIRNCQKKNRSFSQIPSFSLYTQLCLRYSRVYRWFYLLRGPIWNIHYILVNGNKVSKINLKKKSFCFWLCGIYVMDFDISKTTFYQLDRLEEILDHRKLAILVLLIVNCNCSHLHLLFVTLFVFGLQVIFFPLRGPIWNIIFWLR